MPTKLKVDDASVIRRDRRFVAKAQQVRNKALKNGEYLTVSRLAVPIAIAIDKVQLLSGKPTQLIANVHEHRHSLAQLATRLASIIQLPAEVPADKLPALST